MTTGNIRTLKFSTCFDELFADDFFSIKLSRTNIEVAATASGQKVGRQHWNLLCSDSRWPLGLENFPPSRMAERARRNLPYGHFGRAGYSPDDQEWRFQRSLTAILSINPLGSPKEVYKPEPQAPPKPEQSRKEPQGNRQRRQIKDLVSRIPEFQPAAALLPDLLRVSEAAQTAIANHDATQGRLITATNIRSEVQHHAVRIAALPVGDSRSALRLIQVQKQRRGWADTRKRWINVPTLFGEEVVWASLDGPIQQVSFAEPVDRGEPLLGVRLLTKTMIFRPKHGVTQDNIEAASSIQPNLLYTVDIAATGNVPHSDVAFNPWFSQQVGIIDQAGSWTVMEFQSRNLLRIARSWNGSVKSTAPSDGWARIAWISNLDTIVVCTRQSLVLFQISGQKAMRLHTISPEIANGAQWILDFAVLPGYPDHCVLLTSTQLLLYQVSCMKVGQIKVHTKCTLEHFKNPEDTSLRMSMWSVQEDVFVLLYTSRGSMNTVYRFSFHNETQLQVHEPFEVPSFHNDNSTHIRDISIVSSALTIDNRALDNRARSVDPHQYIVATVMFSDGSVIEQLMCCSDGGKQAKASAPSWEIKLSATATKSEHSGFIDDTDIKDGGALRLPPSRRARLSAPRRVPEERAIELDRVARKISALLPSAQSFEHALERVKSAFDAEENMIMPLRTLDSLIPDGLDSANIESLAANLNGLSEMLSRPDESLERQAEASGDSRKLQVVNVATPPVLQFGAEFHDRSLISIYNTIVAGWLGPLSDEISGRVRLAKVALARQIATDLALASRIVRIEDSEPPAEAPANSSDIRSTWDLPVRPSAYGEPESSSSALRSSQYSALPTPSPTATPSIATMSTGLSTFAAPEIYRLSKYVPITKPSPLVLARPMRKVLSHWIDGDSPEDYDWKTASKDLQREEENEEDEDMTEKERKRLHRQAERHMKRQRREAEASQAQQMASSQAPEIMAASQPNLYASRPGQATHESQPAAPASSQPSIPRAAAASQVVPGRFGGRGAPAKKKRKSGF